MENVYYLLKKGIIMNLLSYLSQSADTILTCKSCSREVGDAIDACVKSLETGHTIFWAGNGGSAAESQHLSAELVGRFMSESLPYRSVALTVDTSAITAIGNDYGFDSIFSRQLEGLGARGDVVIAFTTSGYSKNIVKLLKKSKEMGVCTICFIGKNSGEVGQYSDILVQVQSDKTWFIQESHGVMGHFICASIEKRMLA
jgi:D-sedoheptulose 7-phosphate isomerase